jgi:hypothetical protein
VFTSRLVGHSGTTVVQVSVQVMDRLFAATSQDGQSLTWSLSPLGHGKGPWSAEGFGAGQGPFLPVGLQDLNLRPLRPELGAEALVKVFRARC